MREQPKVQAKEEDALAISLGETSPVFPMSPLSKQIELSQRFYERYGTCEALCRAPGRASLIGEHTDYNGGFVLPVAIDLYMWVVFAPRRDEFLLVAYSAHCDEEISFVLNDVKRGPQNNWGDYLRGVAWALTDAGYRIRGANLLICGEVPIGSGLSSSAAIEVATALALLQNSGISASRLEVAKICQRAENDVVGSRCGIMDQFVACHGEANQAVLLDCHSLDYQLAPVPPEVSSPELDLMVDLAKQHASVYGARMMGGGFGGCTVNLVDTDHAPEFRHEIARAYSLKTELCPEVYILSPSRAAEAVTIEH